MPLNAGDILQGTYRIIRPLESGGMGDVFLAEHIRLPNVRFAIKERRPDPSLRPGEIAQLRRQFEKEAGTLARLDHPNLPKVSNYFAENGNEYLVMDFVEGQNLAQALGKHIREQGRPLPEKPVLLWADQVLDALDYMHRRPDGAVIHRDIKPANIILTPEGRIKLVDFGLVKLASPTGGAASRSLKMGTLAYAPGEQYAGDTQHADARSDVYALGATLYHLLTGVEPPPASMRAANPALMRPPRAIVPALSAATESAVLKACALPMDARFATARDMRAALAAARGAVFVPDPTPPRELTPVKPGTPPRPSSLPPATPGQSLRPTDLPPATPGQPLRGASDPLPLQSKPTTGPDTTRESTKRTGMLGGLLGGMVLGACGVIALLCSLLAWAVANAPPIESTATPPPSGGVSGIPSQAPPVFSVRIDSAPTESPPAR